MIEFFLSLPTWVGCGVAMIFTAVVGLVVYFVSYKLISKYQSDELKDPTSSLFRVVGLLVSLMLSLAFSEVVYEVRLIHTAVEREAIAISDTIRNLELFDIERTQAIRTTLLEYTQAVIDDDWPALANDKLGQRAEALRRQFTEALMRLEPATSNQKKLWSFIAADIDALSDHRFIRLDAALAKPPLYIYVIIFGFLITMACFGAYRPQGPLVVLVSLYTVFVGLVLFLIVKLSDPFQGDISVAPTAFEYLVEALQSEIR
jgi:hypothetical protein